MSWTDARAHCQQHYIDLVTSEAADGRLLAAKLAETGVSPVWIGLRRDPANASLWKWTDLQAGTGLTGDDLSNSSYWLSGEQGRVCAFTKRDKLWYTDLCARPHNACCSQGASHFSSSGNFTWDEASQCCARKNASLVTFTYMTDMVFYFTGWIGLYRMADNKWSWIGNQSSSYTNWAPGEPSPPDCGCFDTNAVKWRSGVCSQNLFFVCSDDNLLVVNESSTWEQAHKYCGDIRSPCNDPVQPCVYRYQLLSLQNSGDYSYVRERMHAAVTTDEVWIGLRFLGDRWWWANGQALDDQECPSLPNHCGTLSNHGTDSWTARDCLERRNFICAKYKSYAM